MSLNNLNSQDLNQNLLSTESNILNEEKKLEIEGLNILKENIDDLNSKEILELYHLIETNQFETAINILETKTIKNLNSQFSNGETFLHFSALKNNYTLFKLVYKNVLLIRVLRR